MWPCCRHLVVATPATFSLLLREYERQKLEILIRNVDIMKAKGCDKSLVKDILNQYEKTAEVLLDATRWSSDDNEEDVDYEDREDLILNSKKRQLVVPNESRASQMAAVKEKNASQRNEGTRGIRMAKVATMSKEKQMRAPGPKELHTAEIPKQASGSKTSGSERACSGNNPKQGCRSKKQVKPKNYCSPGSMSAYANLRHQMQQQKQQQLKNPVLCRDEKRASSGRAESVQQDLHVPDIEVDHQEVGIEEDEAALNEENDHETMNMADHNSSEPENEEMNDEILEEIPEEQSVQGRSRAKKINPAKRTRGPTKLFHVHARKPHERPVMVVNSYGVPIGPTRKLVMEFSRFLGTLARDCELMPLNYVNWPSLPEGTGDKVWEYVLRCYKISERSKPHVLTSVDNLWRAYKSRMKTDHYYSYDDDETRWTKHPKTIPEDHFADLLKFWNLPQIQEESERNKANRAANEDVHTAGPISFALKRHELEQADPNKQPPTQAKMYMKIRKRTPGRMYKTKDDKIQANMEKMRQLESEQREGGASDDPYTVVMKKKGRKRGVPLHGSGVTETSMRNKGKGKYIIPDKFMQSIKSDFISEVVPDVARIVISQLKVANPGINIEIPQFQISLDHPNDTSAPSQQDIDQNGLSSPGTTIQNQARAADHDDQDEAEAAADDRRTQNIAQ